MGGSCADNLQKTKEKVKRKKRESFGSDVSIHADLVSKFHKVRKY